MVITKPTFKRKTAILDRDGVVIEYVPDMHRIEDVKIRNNTPEAIRLLNESGVLVVVATNQPMIANGLLTIPQLEQMHLHINEELKTFGARIDKFYYCSHHSKDLCDCRKPKTGMLEQADKDFSIDISTSWMIGDTWRDVQCGKNFGLKTVGLCGGAGFPYKANNSKTLSSDSLAQPKPDLMCNDLLEAARVLVG